MKVLTAAERRLITALDRLDRAVGQGARRIAEAPPPPPDTVATLAETAISAEIAALHARQAATLEAMQMRLTEAHDRLTTAGAQAARLAAANDELAQANRALIEAAGGGPEAWADSGEVATFAALQAEVEALRAARAAEVEQMGGILDALDQMLGVSTTTNAQSMPNAVRFGSGAGTQADQTGRSDAPSATSPAAHPDESVAEIRNLSVIRDEDPLPEDEPAPDDVPEEIAFGHHGGNAEEERR